MSRFLLDTSTLIDFSKGRQPVVSRLLALIGGEETIGVSAISVAEFFAGISPDRHVFWREFFDTFDFWDVNHDAAVRAGDYLFSYARQELTLSTTDALQAAVAALWNAVLVTDNPKHFPMPEVELLSLRENP